jgi:hypothetical protein
MNDPANPVRINEKWIVTIIWVALLTLLYETTFNGAVAGFVGNIRNFYAAYFSNGVLPSDLSPNPSITFVAFVMLAMSMVLIFVLFDAWSKFVQLTNQMLIAFVQSSLPGERNPILFELLHFKPIEGGQQAEPGADAKTEEPSDTEEEAVETNPAEAVGSIIGNLLRSIAICWVVIILTPGIIIFISLIVR